MEQDNYCFLNHTLSAEPMEKQAAVEAFLCSVGDRVSSPFGDVLDTLFEKNGEEYVVIEEDFVGHIQRIMGSSLRKYKIKKRGIKLPDNGTVGGSGRLTDAVIDSFDYYYGLALRNNKTDLQHMKNAVWAIYYYCIIA